MVCAVFSWKGRDIIASSAYRPPGQSAAEKQEALDYLCDFFAGLGDDSSNLMLGADLNINALNPIEYQPLLEIFNEFDLSQKVDFPTHHTNTADTAIDLLVVGEERLIREVGSGPPFDNHHDLLFMSLRKNVRRPLPKKRLVRLWKKANWDGILTDMLAADLGSIVDDAPNASVAASEWTARFMSIINNHIPLKLLPINPKTIGLTPELRKLLRKKDAAYRKWR
jgi:hypothetical protein